MKATQQSMRMCVSCHKKLEPTKLKRFSIVDGKPIFDTTQKQPGRGQYICSDECLNKFETRKQKGSKLRKEKP